MTYEVEFKEVATVERVIYCTVEADSPEEVETKVRMGDYMFMDSWDDNDLGSDFVGIVSISDGENETE